MATTAAWSRTRGGWFGERAPRDPEHAAERRPSGRLAERTGRPARAGVGARLSRAAPLGRTAPALGARARVAPLVPRLPARLRREPARRQCRVLPHRPPRRRHELVPALRRGGLPPRRSAGTSS